MTLPVQDAFDWNCHCGHETCGMRGIRCSVIPDYASPFDFAQDRLYPGYAGFGNGQSVAKPTRLWALWRKLVYLFPKQDLLTY